MYPYRDIEKYKEQFRPCEKYDNLVEGSICLVLPVKSIPPEDDGTSGTSTVVGKAKSKLADYGYVTIIVGDELMDFPRKYLLEIGVKE